MQWRMADCGIAAIAGHQRRGPSRRRRPEPERRLEGAVGGEHQARIEQFQAAGCDPSRWRPGWRRAVQPAWLERADLLGLGALGALASGVLDPLVLCKAAEAVSLNGGVVNEDVGGTVV